MKLGVIADDFTGASDIALTLAEAGFSTTQFIGVPTQTADPELDAGVIALKSRTAPVSDAVAESLQACDWLTAQGAKQIVLKVCSTFDSTPSGNIGPVLEELAVKLGETNVIVCPAFPENGRSVFQGHLFVGDVLLNESGMQDHPLTPMTDPDLRRVLKSQTAWDVSHVGADIVSRGPADIQAALPKSASMTIVDAIKDADLHAIGAAAKDRKVLCGGSGIALGLPANFGASPATPQWEPVSGPGVVISGSCSRATREQVSRYVDKHPALEIRAADVMSGEVQASDLADWVLAQESAPLVYSSAKPEVVRAAQTKFGAEIIAANIEALFADLASRLIQMGVTRIVTAGGETSGAVVKGLKAKSLRIGPRIAAGVPLVRLDDRPIALALKSGNFGGPELFEDALRVMETAS